MSEGYSSEAVSSGNVDFPPNDPVIGRVRALAKQGKIHRAGSGYDFPILNHPEVASIVGQKGVSFMANIKTEFYYNPSAREQVGALYFPYTCEGPPGCVHGGALATAIDHAFGSYVVRLFGFSCFTLNLNVNYKKTVPLGSVARVVIRQEKIDGKKVWLSAELDNGLEEGSPGRVLYCTSTALFYSTSDEPWDYDIAMQLFGRESDITVAKFIRDLQARQRKRAARQGKAKL